MRWRARRYRWGDYEKGEKIDHVDGITVEEAEHMIATRLYQNTAKVHFNQFSEGQGRFGRRLIYGGHVISLARALSFNGLGNAFHIAAINAGRHVAPLFAGDTVFAWSEILDTAALPGRDDVGALRVRLVATKNQPCANFPLSRGRRLRSQRRARFRHLGPDAALRDLAMRLPADAALIVIDVQQAIDDPIWGPRNNIRAEAVDRGADRGLARGKVADRAYAPRFDRAALALSSRRARQCVQARGGAAARRTRHRRKRSQSAFADTELEAALDEIGADHAGRSAAC